MKTLYINFKLLDGTADMQVKEGLSLLVEDGKISKLCENVGADLSGVRTVDLGGRYLLPGLINLHVHLPASGKPEKKAKDKKKIAKLVMANSLTKKIGLMICKSGARAELLSGVTTVRTVGGVGDLDSILRDKIDTGAAFGPRILAANTAIGTVGGHMVGTVAKAVASPEEAVFAVNALADEGVDLIKLMITGGVLDAVKRGEPGVMKMPPEYIRAACDAAHARGLKVAAHAESSAGVLAALENGVDTVEHGAFLDEESVRLLHKNHAALICTISPAVPFAKFDRALTGATEMAQYNGNVVLDGVVEGAKVALKEGIPVGLGTDTGCPFVTHYDMWRELAYYCHFVGVSPEFALYSATLGNAKIAGIEEETGSISEGKSADFIVAETNPLDSFEALRAPFLVVFRGKEIASPRPKKIRACEEALDRYMKEILA